MAEEGPKEEPASPSASPPTEASAKGNEKTTKVLRRACDCCRKRKVRCDGTEPCGPCKKASIRCAYLQPPKKKGPKGLRSAKVLHALRRIDDTVAGQADPRSPVGAQHSGEFGNWGWNTAQASPTAMQGGPVYGPPSSMPQMQPYYAPPMSAPGPSLPPIQPGMQPTLFRSDTQDSAWSTHTAPPIIKPDTPMIASPVNADALPRRLRGDSFMPFVHLFFSHMFPIMPVIDHNKYLDPRFYNDSNALSHEDYAFLCALCATTAVQLDATVQQPPRMHPTKSNDEVFASECLRERKEFDYISSNSTLTCLTSFMLFAFYGNSENYAKAWFYLQEAITCLQNLNMDDEETYAKFDPAEAQWRRRIYWLLFITERAYAVQRRKQTRLNPTVDLPAVFESEDPHLLNGFVNLANLFSAVDDSFVAAWRGSRRQSLCNEEWLAATQKQLDAAALALDVTETQQIDIAITREWLHILAWQMGVSNGLIWGRGEGGMRLDYPIELARKVVEIIRGVSDTAVDSHGIGMEQKLSDIAGCLADVLKCTAGDASPTFQEGKQCLNILLQKLSTMRGKESVYLKPLMHKVEELMGYEQAAAQQSQPAQQPAPPPQQQHLAQQPQPQQPSTQHLPLPEPSGSASTAHLTPAGFQGLSGEYLSTERRFSMADSLGMLRSLSMSGNLGMPLLMGNGTMEEWAQRRPSAMRLFGDEDAAGGGHGMGMGGWQMVGGAAA